MNESLHLHPQFCLNGKNYNKKQLAIVCNKLLDKGEVYEQEAALFITEWLNEDLIVEVKTSGSTGIPKKIQIEKMFMQNSAIATGTYFSLPAGTKALLCLSARFIAGKMMLVRAMVLGWDIDLRPYQSSPLADCTTYYDFCAMVPMQLNTSIARLNLIRKLIVGGGKLSAKQKESVLNLPTRIFETYGMTETVSHIAVRQLNNFSNHEENNGGAFEVLPDITISQDARQCLVIKAPKITRNLVTTNDVVQVLTAKRFIWLGRFDHVINSGGVKLHPEVIEKKLESLFVGRFFVAGIPDDLYGEKLIIIIEGDLDLKDKPDIQRQMKENLTLLPYEIPKDLYFLTNFYETPTGKIHRANSLKAALLSH